MALAAFGVIIVAELGDLTQILTANLAAHYHQPWSVFVGASVALVASWPSGSSGAGPSCGSSPCAASAGWPVSSWPGSPFTPPSRRPEAEEPATDDRAPSNRRRDSTTSSTGPGRPGLHARRRGAGPEWRPPCGPAVRGAAGGGATFVEIGAWCGKSTVYLGAAAEATAAVLFSLDHHHGSEENQPGWDHHDHDVVDPATGRIDTLPFWRRTVDGAGLGPVGGRAGGRLPHGGLAVADPSRLLFIDGGHGAEPAWADFHGWAPHVALGRWLAIHDVFPDPADGGRPPYELWTAALASGQFVEDGECGSLRLLRRVAPPVVERADLRHRARRPSNDGSRISMLPRLMRSRPSSWAARRTLLTLGRVVPASRGQVDPGSGGWPGPRRRS